MRKKQTSLLCLFLPVVNLDRSIFFGAKKNNLQNVSIVLFTHDN